MTEHEANANDVSSVPLPAHRSEPFIPDRADSWFACASFLLGFLFIRWVFFSWQGWGVSLFTFIYISAVTLYLHKKGRIMSGEAWYWLSILLFTGLSFSLWQANSLLPWRALLLFCAAVYWVLSATKMTLLGITSNWLPLDYLHGLVVVPFQNFGSQYRSMTFLRKKHGVFEKQLISIGLGVLLALIVLAVVSPLLIRADAGGFEAIILGIGRWLQWVPPINTELLIHAVLAIPTAAYLYGLVVGSAHGRRSVGYNFSAIRISVDAFRKLPAITVTIMLGLISGLYLVFIFSQLPYFFSAFFGVRPEGWQLYSEYARRGFFDLCVIAVINLMVLVATNLGVEKDKRKMSPLRMLNSLLALLTILLIATAFSKVALYISVYGLTVERLLPSVFLVFLAVVFGGVIALQRRQFSIMRLAAFVGVALLCMLCLTNLDSFVANYNAERYLSGTLAEFDVIVLYRAGPAGVNAALKLYELTDDIKLRESLNQYLNSVSYVTSITSGTLRDTLQNTLARRKLAQHALWNDR